jgi:hypothetical protein
VTLRNHEGQTPLEMAKARGRRQIVAMTRYDNPASIGVMRKLGMRIEHNLLPDPPWLQVVGIIESRTN